MKITAIETLVCHARMRNWIFVKVLTDQPGLHGWGEATLEWHTRAVVGAIEDIAQLLIGEDPTRIEHSLRRPDRSSVHRHFGRSVSGVLGAAQSAGAGQHCRLAGVGLCHPLVHHLRNRPCRRSMTRGCGAGRLHGRSKRAAGSPEHPTRIGGRDQRGGSEKTSFRTGSPATKFQRRRCRRRLVTP